jgi:hypothetical protein
MSGEVYANFYAYEASVSVATNVSLPWKSRRIVITNDSSTTQVSIGLKGATFHLHPSESWAAEFQTHNVSINVPSAAVGIRIWVWG